MLDSMSESRIVHLAGEGMGGERPLGGVYGSEATFKDRLCTG